MKIVSLSIDWDFFFPDISRYDLGCKEAKFFIDTVWSARSYLKEEFIPSGHREFWDKMRELKLIPSTILVTESHLYSYEMANLAELDTLIIFDQHLDIYAKPKKYITCENWLAKYVGDREKQGEKLPKIYVVVPYWVDKEKIVRNDSFTDAITRLEVIYLKELRNKLKGKLVVIPSLVCRSGASTPPWADKEFKLFLELSSAELLKYEGIGPRPRILQDIFEEIDEKLLEMVRGK